MFAVISLERALSADPVMLKMLGERIASIEEQRLFRQQYQSGIDDATIVELAELYQATLGKIEPRIKVSGSRQQLQIPANIQSHPRIIAGCGSRRRALAPSGRKTMAVPDQPRSNAGSFIQYSLISIS